MSAILQNSYSLLPDLTQARRFLTLLDESAESFTFQTFDDNKARADKRLARVLHGTLGQHAATLALLNRQGAGVFVTVNETDGHGRKIENIVRIRAVWQEADRADVPPLPLEPHIIVETSPGKYHRYVFTDGATDLAEFKPVQERIARDFGSDPNAMDLARVLRLPGFYHCKRDPYLVRIVAESGALLLPWAEVQRLFPPVERRVARPRNQGCAPDAGIEARIHEALAAIDPDADYGAWLSIGMALHEGYQGGARGGWPSGRGGARGAPSGGRERLPIDGIHSA